VVFVFDNVLTHALKEKHVYHMADQVQGPTNILNEIMEQTGIFKKDESEVTSIFLIDTDSSSD
jgi:hypothetical protein